MQYFTKKETLALFIKDYFWSVKLVRRTLQVFSISLLDGFFGNITNLIIIFRNSKHNDVDIINLPNRRVNLTV